MTSSPRGRTEFPERLLQAGGRAGQLIEDALAEPVVGPSEPSGFRRLVTRRKRAVLRSSATFSALAVGFAALVVWLGRAEPEPPLVVAPEPGSRTTVQGAAERSVQPAEQPRTSPSALPTQSSRRTPQREPKSPQSQRTDDASQCTELARRSEYEAAVGCYDRVSRGSSMAAELSLYEKARLQSKALGKSSAALDTLEGHALRFPSGVLGTEVAMSRIELLIQLGRRAPAVAAIESALQGPPGSERRGDLQALRAELAAGDGDCATAREALELAEAAGVHPSRLLPVARRCPAASEAPRVAPAAEPLGK